MTISEQIAELAKLRAKKAEALEELRLRCEKENRIFTTEEQAACDQLVEEVKGMDAQTVRLREMEQLMARQSVPVDGGNVRVSGGKSAMGPGIGFTRCVRAIMLSKGNLMQAQDIARTVFRDTPEIALSLQSQAYKLMQTQRERAAVPFASTLDPAWAGALVAQQTLSGEFIALMRPLTITGRLQLRRVPFLVKIPREVTPIGTAQWVGEGKPKPVGKGAYDLIAVPMAKLALIVVHSEELARSSDPASEELLRDGLLNSISNEKNKAFIGNAAPTAGVSPGGILYGLPGGQSFASSGNSVQAVNADIVHAISLLNGGLGFIRPAWIMNTLTKTWLSGLMNPAGTALMYPTVGQSSSLGAVGTLAGFPIIDSQTQPADSILLIDQGLILLAEDDSIEIDISREASLQMESAPADPAASMLSLWQNDLIGLRGDQFTYWLKARDNAIVQITGVGYTTWPPVLTGAEALQSQTPPPAPTPASRSSKAA